MAMGIPVVSTSIGVEGIPAEDVNNIAIADDPETFVDRVVKLLQDRELHRRISKNAHTLVEKKFSWEKGVELLEEMLEKVVTEG
jgi:glycosyltransferase involved in cell wall biosynthesis